MLVVFYLVSEPDGQCSGYIGKCNNQSNFDFGRVCGDSIDPVDEMMSEDGGEVSDCSDKSRHCCTFSKKTPLFINAEDAGSSNSEIHFIFFKIGQMSEQTASKTI